MATLQPDRIEAMVVVSAAMYFPEQARAIMRRVPAADNQPPQEWETMRKRHKLGDEQIVALWEWTRGMKDSYDDMNFTPPSLSRITASTLIVYGDRDPLYPVEMAIDGSRDSPVHPLGRAKRRTWARLLRRFGPVRSNGARVLSNVG